MILNVLIHRLKEIINSPKLDPYKSEHFDNWLPIYQRLNLEHWKWQGDKMAQGNMGMWQDRTRTIPHYLKMGGWEPLPEIDSNFNKPWKQICLETADKIVKQANGQQINILWSGGLDSTCVLFSLLEVTNHKQIKVFGNYSSIVESGSLFDTYIKGKGISYNISPPTINPIFDEGLIVSGYLGDQIFGRYQTLNEEQFSMPWKDFIIKEQAELTEQILENWPGQPLKTVPDFLSFIELNCKWQMGKTNRKRNMPREIADRMINFYETVDFQKWSLGNYEPKWLNSNVTTYKYPIRTMLAKLMNSDVYPLNKVVQTSHYHVLQHDWVMLLEDGTNLYLKDFM
jgi:hypothetical protein